MHTLPDHFDELKSNIEPKKERVELAKELPQQIRNYLKECDGIRTIAPHSRLCGSYARSTTIKDIKDVDILLFVHGDYGDEPTENVLNDVYQVLKDFPDYLGTPGRVEPALRHQRRSINIELEDLDFNMDIVPVIANNGLDKSLLIPDRDWEEWVDTHPLGYAEYLSKLNCDHESKIVPLIKMLKHWRDVHMVYRRPKSYWLECLVCQLLEKGKLTTDEKGYAILYKDTLEAIQEQYNPYFEKKDKVPKIPDPMLGHNVAFNWTRSSFETFMRRIEETVNWANRALSDNIEYNDAIELWQKIFNTEDEDWFPAESATEKANALKSASIAGSIYVEAGTGRVQTMKPEVRYVQPPSHHFYGENE